MEFILLMVAVGIIFIIASKFTRTKHTRSEQSPSPYSYAPKETIMTPAEIVFYKRLASVAGDRYVIFPQIHLSALAMSKATGKYYKSGRQRINQRSLDYVLCDKTTLQPVYAVELDDRTHDMAARKERDSMVEGILKEINLPLVRFRNVNQLTDDQIIERFAAAHSAVLPN